MLMVHHSLPCLQLAMEAIPWGGCGQRHGARASPRRAAARSKAWWHCCSMLFFNPTHPNAISLDICRCICVHTYVIYTYPPYLAYAYADVYVYIYTHTYTRMHICIHTHTHQHVLYTYSMPYYLSICRYVCVYIYIYICLHLCLYHSIYPLYSYLPVTYLYLCINLNTHTYI